MRLRYVDLPKHAYGRMIMCHMLADTAEELHAMADLIGVARRWYQTDASFPHYDISKGKRTLAVRAGAIEVDRRGLYAVMSRVRKQILEDPVFAATWRAPELPEASGSILLSNPENP